MHRDQPDVQREGLTPTRRAWQVLRRVVPVSAYPWLATLFRASNDRTIRQLQADEADTEVPPDVPPPAFRIRVCHYDRDVIGFIRAGEESRVAIETGLAAAGRQLSEFTNALDFGCGSGRTLRAFRDRPERLELFGTDVDAEAIDWCRRHLDLADFTVNDALPPLRFDDGAFDLVWAISVFTHLDERMQLLWLEELARVIAPGGCLLASFHGHHTWAGLSPWAVARLRRRGFLFVRTDGFKGVLPDWYQATWHTEEYVRKHWSAHFDIVEILERGMHDYQDLAILRRR